MKLFVVLFLVTFSLFGAASDRAQVPSSGAISRSLQAELLTMGEEDQKYRAELQDEMIKRSNAGVRTPSEVVLSLQKKQDEIDERNLARLEEIVRQHGWPGRSLVGEKASTAAFLILQHADLARQKKYFPLFKKAAADGEARRADAAMLEDRILMREGKKQIYGTQVRSGPETGGKLELYPIEDERHVEERRTAVGLPPLADYLKLLGWITSPRPRSRAVANFADGRPTTACSRRAAVWLPRSASCSFPPVPPRGLAAGTAARG